MLSILLRAALLMPGIILHEFAHQLFCHLSGVRVHQVVYFRFGNPAGFVVHSTPRLLRQHCAIVFGPFIVNSLLAIACFVVSQRQWAYLSALWGNIQTGDATQVATGREGLLPAIGLFVLVVWLGWVVALEAIPSRADMRSLWEVTNRHLKSGNWLAIFSYPLVVVLYIANALRFFWLDWVYAGVLGWFGLTILPHMLQR